LVLHWKRSNSTELHLALVTSKPGWAALGWSVGGKMAGSDAVIGNTDGAKPIQAYRLESLSMEGVKPTDTFSLGNKTSVTAGNSGSTVIAFSRMEGTGVVPVKLSGPSSMIFSSSQDGSKTLAYHGPA
ncbi:unnamed protein product, partial [Closterium sp. NIES-65]